MEWFAKVRWIDPKSDGCSASLLIDLQFGWNFTGLDKASTRITNTVNPKP